MNILGYASLNHDPTVAIVRDGILTAAIESEKITRSKHEINVFPEAAIRAVLEIAEMKLSDLDVIATNYATSFRSNHFFVPHLMKMLTARSFDLGTIISVLVIGGAHHPRMFWQLGKEQIPRIQQVRHHRAHLAFSFLSSPWEEAAIAIVDASGEIECTSLWLCSGRKVRKLYSMDLPANSLGSVYMLATRHLGYAMIGDEYKVMGLASLGTSSAHYRKFFQSLIRLEDRGRYSIDAKLLGRVVDGGFSFPEGTRRMLGQGRTRGEPFTELHSSFAFELQRRIEEAVVHVTRHVQKTTGMRRLCLGGGVSLNCVANGRILAESGFDEVFIPPAPHDAGTAAGAALHHHYYDLGLDRPRQLITPYLGTGFSDQDIERDLKRTAQEFWRVSNPSREAAKACSEGLVVGWFQGRTEFGPRALGNRSILADPRRSDMKDRVNYLVKEREAFRPFAPAILEHHAADWFENIRCSPWMLFVDRVREDKRSTIPAVVHADGSARPQTVTHDMNAEFFKLLESFHELTGVPLVLNTSFNVAGEPIVNTPVEALRCYQGSGLDALFIGPFFLAKPHVSWRPLLR